MIGVHVDSVIPVYVTPGDHERLFCPISSFTLCWYIIWQIVKLVRIVNLTVWHCPAGLTFWIRQMLSTRLYIVQNLSSSMRHCYQSEFQNRYFAYSRLIFILATSFFQILLLLEIKYCYVFQQIVFKPCAMVNDILAHNYYEVGYHSPLRMVWKNVYWK